MPASSSMLMLEALTQQYITNDSFQRRLHGGESDAHFARRKQQQHRPRPPTYASSLNVLSGTTRTNVLWNDNAGAQKNSSMYQQSKRGRAVRRHQFRQNLSIGGENKQREIHRPHDEEYETGRTSYELVKQPLELSSEVQMLYKKRLSTF